MEKLQEALQLFENGRVEESLNLVQSLICQEVNIELLVLRSKIYYKMQKWGECLNDLNKILEIDSKNQTAINYKEMVLNIINFWNKDSFNP